MKEQVHDMLTLLTALHAGPGRWVAVSSKLSDATMHRYCAHCADTAPEQIRSAFAKQSGWRRVVVTNELAYPLHRCSACGGRIGPEVTGP